MMLKNCENCKHMITRLPIKRTATGGYRFVYRKAVASCRHGLITQHNGRGVRIFRSFWASRPKAWEAAETCPDFESMEE